MASPSTTSTRGRPVKSVGGPTILRRRLPPPRTILGRSMTRLSTHIGMSAGSPSAVTPPMAIPVRERVWSRSANEALRTPSFPLTAWFTSRRVVASSTQATKRGRIRLADDQDGVGCVLEGVPVGAAEGIGVRELRIASDHLVRHLSRRQLVVDKLLDLVRTEVTAGCPGVVICSSADLSRRPIRGSSPRSDRWRSFEGSRYWAPSQADTGTTLLRVARLRCRHHRSFYSEAGGNIDVVRRGSACSRQLDHEAAGSLLRSRFISVMVIFALLDPCVPAITRPRLPWSMARYRCSPSSVATDQRGAEAGFCNQNDN